RSVNPVLIVIVTAAQRVIDADNLYPLRIEIHNDAALSFRDREPGLRAEECLILDPELVGAGDGDFALSVWIAMADDDRADDVGTRVVAEAMPGSGAAVVDRLLLGRALRVDDRLERLVGDADPLRGPTCLLRMLGSDDRDRLAEVADALDRKHRLVGELEP